MQLRTKADLNLKLSFGSNFVVIEFYDLNRITLHNLIIKTVEGNIAKRDIYNENDIL